MEKPGRLVVLGVGNEERGDDAAGVLCLRLVRRAAGRRRDLLFLQGGVAPENMTGTIRAFSPSLVLILDAVLAGRRPGTIFAFDPESISEEELTTHRLPLSHLIRYLEKSIGCRVLCLGIQPQSLQAGGALSRPVYLAIRTFARECAALLKNRSASSPSAGHGSRKNPGPKPGSSR